MWKLFSLLFTLCQFLWVFPMARERFPPNGSPRFNSHKLWKIKNIPRQILKNTKKIYNKIIRLLRKIWKKLPQALGSPSTPPSFHNIQPIQFPLSWNYPKPRKPSRGRKLYPKLIQIPQFSLLTYPSNILFVQIC